MAAGRYDVDVGVTSADEVGALAAAFRSMASHIRATMAEAAEGIRDRSLERLSEMVAG